MPSLISIWNPPQTRTRKKSEAISLTMLISSLSKYIFFLSFSSNSSRRHDIFSLIILFSLSVALSIINLFINTFHHYQNFQFVKIFCLFVDALQVPETLLFRFSSVSFSACEYSANTHSKSSLYENWETC